jgi:hypothetical protein
MVCSLNFEMGKNTENTLICTQRTLPQPISMGMGGHAKGGQRSSFGGLHQLSCGMGGRENGHVTPSLLILPSIHSCPPVLHTEILILLLDQL